MNSKHAFLALSTFTLVSIAYGEREVFAPTKLAPTATAGTVQFGDGSAAAPSITFNNDPDTGISRLGANTLSLISGGVAKAHIGVAGGTPNMTIGNSPDTSSTATGGLIRATSGGGTNIAGGNLTIQGGNSTGNAAGGYLAFQTAPAGASGSTSNALTERMRITADGLTQINRAIELGNTITDYPVSTAPQIYSTGNGTGIFADYGNLVLQPRSSGALRNIIFANGNPATERMRIDSAGNVGIGAAPTVKLDVNDNTQATTIRVNGSAAGGSNIRLQTDGTERLTLTSGTANGFITNNNGGLIIGSSSSIVFTANPSSTTRFGIASSGDTYVGNGDTSATPANATIRGTNASGTDIGGPNLTIQAGRGTGTGAGGALVFQTSAAGTTGSTLNAATERMRITSAGVMQMASGSYIDAGAGKFELPNGTAIPATCTVGELFQDTDSNDCINTAGGDGALCICKTTNTWALISNF